MNSFESVPSANASELENKPNVDYVDPNTGDLAESFRKQEESLGQSDAEALGAVWAEIGQDQDREGLEFTKFIGFTPDSVAEYGEGIGDPMSAEYRLDENGNISEFTEIKFFSPHENYKFMEVVRQRFEARGIPTEEPYENEPAFIVSPEFLRDPANLQTLKDAMQVGNHGTGEYIETRMDLDRL